MNLQEAIAYFREMGELLRTEDNKGEQKRFLAQMRQDQRYGEAFHTLRLDAQARRRGSEGATCPFGAVRTTIQDMVRSLGGNPEDSSVIGRTTYGGNIVEFTAGGQRHIIAPVRTTSLQEDIDAAHLIIAERAGKTLTPSINHYPFIRPQTQT